MNNRLHLTEVFDERFNFETLVNQDKQTIGIVRINGFAIERKASPISNPHSTSPKDEYIEVASSDMTKEQCMQLIEVLRESINLLNL